MKNPTSASVPTKDTIRKEKQKDTSISISQILIAIACLVFFPLLYLIGSTIVSILQNS